MYMDFDILTGPLQPEFSVYNLIKIPMLISTYDLTYDFNQIARDTELYNLKQYRSCSDLFHSFGNQRSIELACTYAFFEQC